MANERALLVARAQHTLILCSCRVHFQELDSALNSYVSCFALLYVSLEQLPYERFLTSTVNH